MADATPSNDPLGAALSSVVADAVESWSRLQGDTPNLLYHYTDVAGLIGICATGSLWATNLRFMNDAKELDHATDLMIDVLYRARAQAQSPSQHAVIDAIEPNLMMQAGFPDYYSVSFSADGDLLGQWRGYGSTGGGYAIGFDPSHLQCPPTPHAQPARFLNRVIYDEGVQAETLWGVAETMLSLLDGLPPTGSDVTEPRANVFAALGEVAGYVFSFKDPAWAEEREWRAVYVMPSGELEGIQYRPAGGLAVPFVNLAMGTDPAGRLPIRRIVQGPSLDPETAERSLAMLLASNDYQDVEIARSAIPLRV